MARTSELTGELLQKGKLGMKGIIMRDWRLLRVVLVMVVLMNIPFGKYILYPFTIFSTWIHEMCHGLAAIIIGGKMRKLLVYPDGSGLAYSSIPGGKVRRAFVASAGYQGTAVVGCLLLLFRRTKRGPRLGTLGMAFAMLLSAVLVLRNPFGFYAIGGMGLFLVICGLKLPSSRMRDIYMLIAATCSLNAITSIQDLFGSAMYVNGQASTSDAHTVADRLGGTYWSWAMWWFIFAIIMTFIGVVFAINGQSPDELEEDDLPCSSGGGSSGGIADDRPIV